MRTLEEEERRGKRLMIVGTTVLLALALVLGVVLASSITSAVKDGVDPLEARINALERIVAEQHGVDVAGRRHRDAE